MFRLVIADDERLIIKGLEKILDWKSLNIEIVGEYSDGKSALESIIALSPDIALLDISMPGLSGIDVLKTISEQALKTNVIFISGFQDFEYVKAAIRHGAKDYLLKPVVRSELLKAIEKCLPEKIKKGEERKNGVNYSDLLKTENGFLISKLLVKSEQDSPLSRLLNFSIKEEVKEKVALDSSLIFEEDEKDVFILFPHQERVLIKEYLERLRLSLNNGNSNYVSFIISRPVYSVAAIKGEKEFLGIYSGFSFFSQYLKSFILDTEHDTESVTPLSLMEKRDSLFQSIISHNRDEYERLVNEFLQETPSYTSYTKSEAAFFLCNLYKGLYDRLREAMINLSDPDIRGIMDNLLKCKDYSEMASLFLSGSLKLYSVVSSLTGSSSEKEFMIALDYIEKHYREPIGLKTIADVVNMNAYYFSSYFKKNTGVNFKDYLRKVRMNHAMNLIVSSDLSLTAIAKEVGLMDVRTFSDLFYKTYGEKPRDCVRRIRGEVQDDV